MCACVLLLQLHVEYLTFLILLLYLGGILIFFLFTALMLNNEYDSSKQNYFFSFENIILFIIVCKTFFIWNILNNKVIFFTSLNINKYIPSLITDNLSITNYLSTQNDVILFICLYSEKYLLLIFLGLVLLFTMIGVIVITKNKHVQ